ncbi:hypothetical protein ABZ345_45490 [Lentzea sp. NPDC005914]|uniref:hypothetical protein n=1 Tax=Lentzea sp. NPDC005914 TaxID=3154572 RepID=UPI0033C35802
MIGHVLAVPGQRIVRTVTAIMSAVVGLSFLFGFGNVLNLALRLGVPAWVAPLVAPAVDLTILGLLLGMRYLALHGVGRELLRPARRLLLFASIVTLALNVAEPMLNGEFGRAAFDSIGPILLIGWAEVGPNLLQVMTSVRFAQSAEHPCPSSNGGPVLRVIDPRHDDSAVETNEVEGSTTSGELLAKARRADIQHWLDYKRPISAETLRRQLEVSADRARELVSAVRAELADRLRSTC